MYRQYLLTSASALVLPLVFASDMAAAQTSEAAASGDHPGTGPDPSCRSARRGHQVGRQARQARSRHQRVSSGSQVRPANALGTYNPALDLPGLKLPPGTTLTTAGPVDGYRALSAFSATKTATPIEQVPQSIRSFPRASSPIRTMSRSPRPSRTSRMFRGQIPSPSVRRAPWVGSTFAGFRPSNILTA